jgi:hypothetical protein
MIFTWRDHLTVHASGPIEAGDAAQFAALSKFNTLELDSPGGSVGEALRMVANMDARGGVRAVVKPGSSCASACAMALFVSGKTRVVYMGGRLGIDSCAMSDGTPAPECNEAMAANAVVGCRVGHSAVRRGRDAGVDRGSAWRKRPQRLSCVAAGSVGGRSDDPGMLRRHYALPCALALACFVVGQSSPATIDQTPVDNCKPAESHYESYEDGPAPFVF